MEGNAHRRGLVLTTSSSLIWGTVFISIGVGFHYLDPYSLLLMRFLVASITIALISIPYGKRLGIGLEIKRPVNWLLGFIYFSGFIFQYVGQSFTNASDATLISNLAPILAPMVAFVALKDKISRGQGVALFLGLVGLFLVAGPKFDSNSSNVIGDGLLFLTSVSYAVFIILSKRLNAGSIGAAFAMIISMAIFSAPFAIYNGFSISKLDFGFWGWAAILWMSLPCGVLAISLYLKGLDSISISESAMLLLLQVITGLVLAIVLLDENPSAFEILGAVAISAAVVFSSIRIESIVSRLNPHQQLHRPTVVEG